MTYFNQNMTASECLTLADWHMDQSKKFGDLHDMIAFHLFKMARERR